MNVVINGGSNRLSKCRGDVDHAFWIAVFIISHRDLLPVEVDYMGFYLTVDYG